jgi:hypothetical protein
VLHPVGPLPTAVYWRRRLLALGALGVLCGGGWLGAAAATGDPSGGDQAGAGPSSDAPARPPALESVLPALAAVRLPSATPATASAARTSSAPEPAAPVAGGPCSDEMISVVVRPETAAEPVGSKPTFDLVVTNVSPVACVRVLDKGLQEVVLLDGAGKRVWGSNDCFPEASSDTRTLEPGEAVVFPVLWSGLTSAPGCTADRSTPKAGDYVLRGRLDTATSGDAAFTLT